MWVEYGQSAYGPVLQVQASWDKVISSALTMYTEKVLLFENKAALGVSF